jgi:hypothetical protein
MIEALTAVLVAITGYYAWQNQRMVSEMKATRAASVLPKIALNWYSVGPDHSFVQVASVGTGPALDVDVTVRFVPRGDGPELHPHIQASLMVPGESHEVMPTRGLEEGILTMTQITETYDRVELAGKVTDLMGEVHEVHDVMPDLAAWRELQREAVISWQHPDPFRRQAKQLADQFKTPLTDIGKSLDRLAAEVRRGRQNDSRG